MRDQRGTSLIELLIAATAGSVVLFVLFAMFDLSVKNSAQITQRVDANARAKPAIQQLMNDLHSACTGPAIAPVLPGSGPTVLQYQGARGSSVTPTPEKHVVALEGENLTEKVYPASGGANPVWTYSGTATANNILLEGVSGPEPGAGSLFSYYSANAGAISATPLPTPLSATNAARAVQVKISMRVEPSTQPVDDENASVTLTDAATFRFSPFSEDPTKVNGPCA